MKHTIGDIPEEEPQEPNSESDDYYQLADKAHNPWAPKPSLHKVKSVGGAVNTPAVVPLYGLTPLQELTRSDLIAEILHHQQSQLKELATSVLLENVVHIRVAEYANKLHKDAHEAEGTICDGTE